MIALIERKSRSIYINTMFYMNYSEAALECPRKSGPTTGR